MEIRNHTKSGGTPAIRGGVIALALAAGVFGQVPLENWRFPFYRIAAERGEYRASPSGMFWDNLPPAAVFDTALWPDSASYAANHWTLAPSLRATASNTEFLTGDRYTMHFNALSDFRFRNFTVRNVLDVDQRYGSDPSYVWHQDRGAAGRIEEASVSYAGRYGFARLGRVNRVWGPFIDRSILLSNNPFSYDAFEWQFHTPFLEFRHLFAAFPARGEKRDGITLDRNRYFAAHALNFMFGEWAAVGVSETVVFARSRLPDLQYINPVSIYSVINTNMEGGGNLMLGLQGWAHPFTKRVIVKGQVAFDDFQVDDEDQGDQEPTHWAFDIGGSVKDPAPMPLLNHFSLDYRYVSKWMYTVSDANTRRGERYTYLGKSLGVQDIDGDWLRAGFTVLGDNYWTATVGGEFTRQDTNTVQTEWQNGTPERPGGSLGYRDEAPLSERDSLRTELNVFIEATGYFRDYAHLTFRFDNRWVRERPDDEREYDPRIAVTLSGHFSDFFLKF